MPIPKNELEAVKQAADKINRELLVTPKSPASQKKAEQDKAGQDKADLDSDIVKFKRFVDSAKLAVSMDNKQYLLAEAWLFIAELKHLSVVTVCTEESKSKNGRLYLCVTCATNLVNANGDTVSSGVMQASKSEDFLKDKPDYAVYGMAQTRSISRAVRNKYGYIARACGFQSTPIDEIK